MKKFEHDCFSPKDVKGGMGDDALKERLNHFGENGWELVSVIVTNYGGETFYFKREKLEVCEPGSGD